MRTREVRRARWVTVMALYLAIYLLSSIYALAEAGRPSEEAGGPSEYEELRSMVSRLESIVEKNVGYFNSKLLLREQNDMAIVEMNSKIQDLQDSIRQIKNSLAPLSLSEKKINYLEDEIRKLWSETRRNNFDINNLESEAHDADEKLRSITSQVQETKDIVNEQWIQIQRLEQGLQAVKVRTSMARRKYTKCTFLKCISDLHRQIELLLSKMDALLRGYPSRAFYLCKNRHYELQGHVRGLLAKQGLPSNFANEELVFFLASAVIIFPFIAAYIMCSSGS